jgi:hypothetical protein
LGWVSALDSCGRTIWIADAHWGDGKRFVVRADEKLTVFQTRGRQTDLNQAKDSFPRQVLRLLRTRNFPNQEDDDNSRVFYVY